MKSLRLRIIVLTTLLPALSLSQWTATQVTDSQGKNWGYGQMGISIVSKDTIYVSASVRNFWRSFDGGKYWEYDSLDAKCFFEKVQFVNARIGWRLESDCIQKTTDSGISWIELTDQIQNKLPVYSELTSLFFIDSLTGWVGTEHLGILKTTDGGLTWSLQGIAKISDRSGAFMIYDIKFRDKLNGIAVGFYGISLTTTNGGTTWGGYVDTDTIPNGHEFKTLSFPGEQRAYAIDRFSKVFRSTDAGATWVARWVDSSWMATSGFRPNDICFTDSLHGWIVGLKNGLGSIYRTSNGGDTWVQDPFTFPEQLFKIAFLDSTTGIALAGKGWILRYTPNQSSARSLNEFELKVSAVWKDNHVIITTPESHPMTNITFYDLLGRKLYYEEIHNKSHIEIPWRGRGPLLVRVSTGDLQKVLQLLPY